jgi:hypothetical protein
MARPLRRRRIRRAVGPEDVLRGAVRVVFATIGFLFQAYIVLGLLLGAVTIGLVVVGNIWQTFVHADASPTPLFSTVPTQATELGVSFQTSREPPPPKVSVAPVPRFAFVCGAAAGGSVRVVRCGSSPAALVGFAQGGRPRGPVPDCAGVWDAYSRAAHYSICWVVLHGGADVSRHPTSDYPFERPNERG